MLGLMVIMVASMHKFALASVLELHISAAEAIAWREALMQMITVNYDGGTEAFEVFHLQAAAALGQANLSFLADPHLLEKIMLAPVVLIKGVDFGTIAPTTADRCKHPSNIPEAVLAGLATKLACRIVGYAREKLYTHPWFHDIRATRGGKEGSNGEGEPLDHHMDMSYEGENAPNYVALAALREGLDPNVTTPLVDNRELYKRLAEKYPQDLALLRNPESFAVQEPLSMGGAYVGNMPMLTGEEDAPVFWLRLNHKLIRPRNNEARQALSRLRGVLHDIESHAVHLVSGDVLLVNNYMCLHRRSAYKPTFTGHDRLLMRAYFKHFPLPPNRIFP